MSTRTNHLSELSLVITKTL